MSSNRGSTTARAIVDDLLGRDTTREIWTGNYLNALPISVQDFDLSAVLPAVFYMFRFGHRLSDDQSGETCATFDVVGCMFDLKARRMVEIPDRIRAQAENLLIPWPPDAAHSV